MVEDDVWRQREKTWICFVLGAPSVAFQAEGRATAAVNGGALNEGQFTAQKRQCLPSFLPKPRWPSESRISFFSSNIKISTSQQVVWKTAWSKKCCCVTLTCWWETKGDPSTLDVQRCGLQTLCTMWLFVLLRRTSLNSVAVAYVLYYMNPCLKWGGARSF